MLNLRNESKFSIKFHKLSSLGAKHSCISSTLKKWSKIAIRGDFEWIVNFDCNSTIEQYKQYKHYKCDKPHLIDATQLLHKRYWTTKVDGHN